MSGSFRLGKIAGIEISIHVSWLIIVILLTWSLATGWFFEFYPGWSQLTYWLISLISTLLLFVSVLVHELAHAVVARRFGMSVKNITLFIFGGAANIEQEPRQPGTEFLMTIVGPLTSLAIAGLAFLLLLAIQGGTSPLAAILGYLEVSNLLLGLFNLIPGFPLDGGRILRSIIWKLSGSIEKATRATVLIGQIVAYLFIFAGIWLFFGGIVLSGLWLGFIGWFLLMGTQSANTETMMEMIFKGVKVDRIMNASPVTVPANITLQKLVNDFFLPGGLRSAFVMQVDQLVGLITLSDIRHISHEKWGETLVSMATIPLAQLHVVSPQQSLNEVLPLIVGQNVNQLPVMEHGELVGVLSRENIVNYLEVRRGLGLEGDRK